MAEEPIITKPVTQEVSLPLDDGTEKEPNVALAVMREAVKQGELKLKGLDESLLKGQEQFTQVKNFLENTQLNKVVTKAQVDAFKEAIKRSGG